VTAAFKPFDVGQRFRVVPPGSDRGDETRIHLIMKRGAFGSGEHETTASCLDLLATLPEVRGSQVLDLGCGTGILAIAAVKLGAEAVLCVDIDPAAVESSSVNCALNGVPDQVTHLCGTMDQVTTGGFDLILANIYKDVLMDVAEVLVSKTRPGGALLLSGIVHEDNFDVCRRYRELGCTVVTNRRLSEFTTVLLQREGSAEALSEQLP
jgi:ribosomal protein L11 methyltransferase